MEIRGTDFVYYQTNDIEKAIEFYRDTLGLEEERSFDSGSPSLSQVVGYDDAHIKGALTQTSLTIPVTGGQMVLGTWQGIFVFEHRTRPHRRQIVLHLAGE